MLYIFQTQHAVVWGEDIFGNAGRRHAGQCPYPAGPLYERSGGGPPSVVSDSTAAAAQLADAASAASFMQDQWRAAAENMQDMGNVVSAYG